jgi:site-specific DNA-methyltransferase (adenine-specific)
VKKKPQGKRRHAASPRQQATHLLPTPAFSDPKHHITIYQGDCLDLLEKFPEESVDLIFADPPYFLSNDGITCHAGRMVSVNKGKWDRSRGPDLNHEFNCAWLRLCQRVLKPNGTIWVSGTSHIIHSVGFALQQLEFKLLNDITWVKPNPPPNLSCRYFTHATETIVWAARNKKSRHTFHYPLMREMAGGKQMKSVWTIPPPGRSEKRFGKHPTQKPLALLERILLASSDEGDLVLDPFMGSGTTAVTALHLSRLVVGIEQEDTSTSLILRRLTAALVHISFAATASHFTLDLFGRFVDRSTMHSGPVGMAALSRLVHRERKYFFVGLHDRQVIYSVVAESMEEAWKSFQASSCGSEKVFTVIKTETEIYLAQ